MKIRSGVTDKKIYFIAVDATDGETFETGLATFTVVRSRNGAADVTYTTPTITEIDATTMPGLYALTLDEDTTLDAGDDNQEYAIRITHAGMAPVSRVIEIYRPKITVGETLDVSSGALNAIIDGLLTAAKFGADFLTAAKIAADVGTEIAAAVWDRLTSALTVAGSAGKLLVDNLNATVSSRSSHSAADIWAVATRLLTAGTNIALVKGTGVIGFNDLSGAQVNTEVDTAIADARLDELLAADSDIDGAAPPAVGSVFHELMTKTAGSFTYDQATDSLEAIRDRGDVAWIAAFGFSTHSAADVWAVTVRQLTDLDNLAADIRAAVGLAAANLDTQLGDLPTAAEVAVAAADAVWDEDATGHQTQGTFGQAIGDPVLDTDTLWGLVNTNLNAAISSRASQASLDTVDGIVDAILVDTGTDIPAQLTVIDDFLDTEVAAILAAVDTELAAIKAKTDNLPASPAATGEAMTLTAGERTAIADALLDRNMATGADSGTASIRTVRQALRALRNKVSIAACSMTVTKDDDVTVSHTAAVTTDAAADPITAIDPAGP